MRPQRPAVRLLVQGLQVLGHDVWLDEALAGGQEWWDTLLSQIRQCDALVAIVARASLDSEPCKREREYAAQLKKAIVPVMLEPIARELPRDLALLQVVDYTNPGPEAAFRLAAAFAGIKPASTLPEPLPLPPPIPFRTSSTSLTGFTRIHSPSMSRMRSSPSREQRCNVRRIAMQH